MAQRTTRNIEHSYTCGQCGFEQYAVIGAETPIPCVDCGYVHREVRKYDVPSEVKLDLTKYNK